MSFLIHHHWLPVLFFSKVFRNEIIFFFKEIAFPATRRVPPSESGENLSLVVFKLLFVFVVVWVAWLWVEGPTIRGVVVLLEMGDDMRKGGVGSSEIGLVKLGSRKRSSLILFCGFGMLWREISELPCNGDPVWILCASRINLAFAKISRSWYPRSLTHP